MLICAIDTSGREGSLALAESSEQSFEVLQSSTIAGGTYSAQLIPTLSDALQRARKEKAEIGLLAVASGPGSFTGLRVGLSTVKALAEVLRVPVVAISVLEAIAFAAGKMGRVLTALDAQRNEVFVGEFEVRDSGSIETLAEALVPSDALAEVRSRSMVEIFHTPDASIAARLREAGFVAEQVARPVAEVYARLGLLKYRAGECAQVESLDANYIRRSDAEIFSAPKLGIKTGKE